MTRFEAVSPSHSVSSSASSSTSFHSHQELDQEDSSSSDLKTVDMEQTTQPGVAESREGSARTTLGDELDKSKLEEIHRINLNENDENTVGGEDEKEEKEEEVGESEVSEKQAGDSTKDELVSAGEEKDTSSTPSGLPSPGEPEMKEEIDSISSEANSSSKGEDEEEEEEPQARAPATPDPNLGEAVTPTSNPAISSPSESKRNSAIKSKSGNGNKGGVAELMKKFQSQQDKKSPAASPARSGSAAETAKKDLPSKSLVQEIDSASLSHSKETQSPVSPTSESNSRQASTSNPTPSQPSSIVADERGSSTNQISSSKSSHQRLDSESLLNPTSPWASEISNSSSNKTIQNVIHSDEPNRFSDSISSSNFNGSSSLGSDAGDDGRKRGNSENGERPSSTRFSTVSLSSNKIMEEELPAGDHHVENRRNTITKTNDSKDRDSNSNHDFLLARLESENGRLDRDPKASRSSIDGTEKLKSDFMKLKEKELKRQSGARHSRAGSREVGSGGSHKRKTSNLREEISNNDRESPGIDETESDAQRLSTPESEEDQIDWDFWGSVMNNYQLIAQTKPVELSRAIQAGIPPALRGMMWQLMSSSKDEEMEIIYAYYLKQTSSHEKSIRRDLSRTFPEQEYFKDGKGVGQENLFNVIKAYSLYDEEVGYCQGMQFIVGPLLLNMPDEEAFSTLVRLMKSYDLRGHFTPNMPSLQLRLFQFECLIEEFLPLLHRHLVRCGIKSSMYASQWFMTLFSYRFPLELVYRVLDSVFAEGIEAVFRFALALMKKSEETLLTLNFEQGVEFLKMNLFDIYLKPESDSINMTRSTSSSSNSSSKTTTSPTPQKRYNTNQFVKDAFSIQITPYQLDTYAAEFEQKVKAANAHRREVDALRLVNKNLSKRIKDLEEQLQAINDEHVDLMNQVVRGKVENDEIANELVRYKVLYAQSMENQ